jgi:hypothetical protein
MASLQPQAASAAEVLPTPEQAAMTQALAQDRPTMEAAVKSFMSLMCARSLTAMADTAVPQPNHTQPQVLQVARAILQSINSYSFAIHATVATTKSAKPGTSAEKKQELLELETVAQLWNGLVHSNQKPSRFLGRRALKLAWKMDLNLTVQEKLKHAWKMDLEEKKMPATGSEDDESVRERQLEWLQEFERLLFFDDTYESSKDEHEDDNDAALIWDADGGASELAKRRQRRKAAATRRGPVTPS